MNAYETVIAEQRAERERKLVADRQRAVLFALESVDTDGYPRVSWYSTEHLKDRGLIEKVPGDKLGRYQLTPEGRVTLQANPAGQPATDELALFGGA
ncbi:hypothetical protein [Mycolicibacterium fortuitum]|uniref:hypothetical protein n=1 Tax=Mycolicibacterium fortuitum TaxID=1766 RepID=UPI00096D6BEE|nr:hypothetical protein [Mycolicibacterium fortuitum]OMC12524.1 hypothetical protein A5734_00900 [Mycolicibacterium fortuitum]